MFLRADARVPVDCSEARADVAADGRRIVFDRAREESDIALIELADGI